jgi:hypothetical protein
MTCALETGRKDTTDGFAISDLWLLPFLLLAQMLARFCQNLVQLKVMRRTRPMPKDWQCFYPGLRQSEWAVRRLCHEGARRIILGEDLDLNALSYDPDPPEDFQPPMPHSALAMHRRLEDIARFHADPERFIRRHAERVRRRAGDGDHRPQDAVLSLLSPFFFFPHAVFQGQASPAGLRIRAPP